MRDQSCLGWFVVIGSRDERPIGAQLFRHLGERDGGARVIGARSNQHIGAAARMLHHAPHDLAPLFQRDGRAFSGGSERDDSVDAAVQEMVDHPIERGIVDLSLPERSDHRDW